METALALTAKQQGWLTLADRKAGVEKGLESFELTLQKTTDLKDFKKGLNDMQTFRKEWTNWITSKLITPMMEYEKRSTELLKQLEAADLEHRKLQQMKEQEIQALENEKADYRAKIVQYYTLMEKNYIHDLYNAINYYYKEGSLELCIDEMKKIKPRGSAPVTNYRYLIEIDKKKIFEAYTIPDLSIHLKSCLEDAEKIFKIPNHKIDNEVIETLEAKAAIETLSIRAATPNVITTKVKSFSKVEVTNQDEAKAVIVAFLKCYNYWDKLLKVRSWDSLTDKMAAAVAKHHDETGELFEGITFKTIEK